jgi:hypothetical protein
MIDVEIIISLATCAVTFVAVFLWVIIRKQMWGELVRVRVNPEDARSEDIAGYFKEIAISLDERPRNLRLVLDGRNFEGKEVALDFTSKGKMEISVGEDKTSFSLRNRWIPEHPIPLVFSSKPKKLFVKQVDANRFRVMSNIDFRPVKWMSPLLCLVATIGVLTVNLQLIVFVLTMLVCLHMLRCQ